jgi:sugar lactone lactonase YvrE
VAIIAPNGQSKQQLEMTMTRLCRISFSTFVAAGIAVAPMDPVTALAQQPFTAGDPLGVRVGGEFQPMSANVKVFGGVVSAESCSYHPTLDLIMVINRGAAQNEIPNDGYVSLMNHDGSLHTTRWIGVNRNGLVLNQPLGSTVHDGQLYVADRDGGTGPDDPSISVVRWFDLETGAPAGEYRVEDSTGFNDIAIAADGTIYGTDTGNSRIYEIGRGGTWRVLLQGAPLAAPNGIAIDNDGNLVVVNIGNTEVLTISPAGALLLTENAVQAGNDGIEIMADGTKYVSSVQFGGVSRIRPGQRAELIASNIPSAASMCYDAGANQLVIPMNANNALAIVPLD